VAAVVVGKKQLSPHLVRITFGGYQLQQWINEELGDEPAQWVKVFPPMQAGRAYTIRFVRRSVAPSVDIDFVTHKSPSGHSPTVSDWALAAVLGDQVELSGPRSGGFDLLSDSDWVWLGADLTALPALMSIVESLPLELNIYVCLQIDEQDRSDMKFPKNVTVVEFDAHEYLPGDWESDQSGQVWVAGEIKLVKYWRAAWLERGLDGSRINGKGYWKACAVDFRDSGE